jgi:hypothetical protein
VYLHGNVEEKTSNTSHAIYEIRDGKFDSGAAGLPEGSYSATVMVHEGTAPPPVSAEGSEAAAPPEPKVTGQWDGTVEIKPETPLTIDVKKSELKRPG